MQPQVLLLDEPLSNLDAKLREKMRRDIRDIQKSLKLTVVYVTHDQIEANTISDRMVIMRSGKIIQVGTPAEIKSKPVDKFVAEFIQ
jgi:iron(III) transport system ATP-binding protein